MQEIEGVMGLAEAAMALRIPYQDAHRLLMLGKIRGVKRWGRWMVQEEDVNRLANEQGVRPGPQSAVPTASNTLGTA